MLAAEADQSAEKPYTVTDGKVDKKTFNGWRRYTESCMRCHGPDGAGSGGDREAGRAVRAGCISPVEKAEKKSELFQKKNDETSGGRQQMQPCSHCQNLQEHSGKFGKSVEFF